MILPLLLVIKHLLVLMNYMTYSLYGDLEEAYRVLNRIQKEGVPAIQIIRSFIQANAKPL